MDQLFFPSIIKGRVNVKPEDLTKDLFTPGGVLEQTIAKKYSNTIIGKVGYIKPGSIRLLRRSQGKLDGSHFNGEITFNVELEVEVARPMRDMVISSCYVEDVDPKLGIIAKPPSRGLPFVIFIPLVDKSVVGEHIRDVKPGNLINVTVKDSKLLPPNKKRSKASYWIVADLNRIEASTELINHPINAEEAHYDVRFEIKTTNDRTSWLTEMTSITIMTIREPYEKIQKLKSSTIEKINSDYADLSHSDRLLDLEEFWASHVMHYIDDYTLVYPPAEYRELLKVLGMDQTYRGLDRSYYITQEILHTFYPDLNKSIIEHFSDKPKMVSLIMSNEGGIIQSLLDSRTKSGEVDTVVVLSSGDTALNGLLKKIRDDQTEISVDGNVVHMPEVVQRSVHLRESNMFDITTRAEISDIFSEQRANIVFGNIKSDPKSVFTEIVYAISAQARDGILVLRIHDMMTDFMVKIVDYVARLYRLVYITKPDASNITNSDKYLVCLSFKGMDDHDLDMLISTWNKWMELEIEPPAPVATDDDLEDESALAYVTNIFTQDINAEVQKAITNFNFKFIEKQDEMFKRVRDHAKIYLDKMDDAKALRDYLDKRVLSQKVKMEEWMKEYIQA